MEIWMEETYHDDLFLVEDGVVGMGLLGRELCVDHGLVVVLGVHGFGHLGGWYRLVR
jgi:hypothetical protein